MKVSKEAYSKNNDFLENLVTAGKRQNNAETKSNWKKFATFCELAKLSAPDSWNLDDFISDIIEKYSY